MSLSLVLEAVDGCSTAFRNASSGRLIELLRSDGHYQVVNAGLVGGPQLRQRFCIAFSGDRKPAPRF
jgi:hypothetical protein